MANFILTHWEGLASLLLSVASISIAIYSTRSTSKDATRQVASVKELGEIQAEASLLAIDVELQKVGADLQRISNNYTAVSNRLRAEEEEIKMWHSTGVKRRPLPDVNLTKEKQIELRNEIKSLENLQYRLSEIRERMLKNKEEGKA